MFTTTQKRVVASEPPTVTTAADLMTPNPVSIRAGATIPEAVAFLVDTGYSAAPVIDEAGQPVGVISRTDIVVYDRENLELSEGGHNWFESADLTPRRDCRAGDVRVRDLMTPTILAVAPDTPAEQAARRMVEQNVHRLFVVDPDGVLVGVISALDLLRHLATPPQRVREFQESG